MNRAILAVLVLASSATSFGITAFQLPWMNHQVAGTTYKSADQKNGVFVVEAYFDTCPYCNDNAPNVDDLAKSFNSEPRVQVLDVGIDRTDSQYKSWIGKHKPNHPVLKDDKRQLIKQLGTSGYPSTYVIDCKGTVRYTSTGVWSSTKERAIKDKVSELLKESCQK